MGRFIELTDESRQERTELMHQFIMLARALEPKKTYDEMQDEANKEILTRAKQMVDRGLAAFKPDMDENVIRKMVTSWQNEKNTELVKNMFSDPKSWWRFGGGE